MASHQQNQFWDFVRSFDRGNNNNNNGDGVDRPAQAPPSWPFGGGFHYGAHPYPPPPPPPHGSEPHHGPGHHGHHPHPPPPEFGGFPFGGPRGFHGGPFGGGPHRGHGRRGRCGRRGERGGDDNEHQGGPFGGSFDLNGLLASLASHPLAQPCRQFFEQATTQAQTSGETARDGDAADEENSFTPPVDIFNTESHFVLHVALPGAKKEDVGINWDGEKGVLNVAGVIYRQGDEEFLKTLTQTERKVGVFERAVKLPPAGNEEKDEIDGDAITAKLEDGVLVVRVPKVEKEWTDVKKVDIE